LERVRPDEAEARALIYSGAMDRFSPGRTHRAALLWRFAAWCKRRFPGNETLSLFSGPALAEPPPPELPPDDLVQNLRREFAVLGFLCDRHPMVLFAEYLQRENTVKAVHMGKYPGRRVRFAGWLITGKTVLTRKGDPMTFITFEDETGLVESVFFPRAYHRFCHILEYGRPFLLSGTVREYCLEVEEARPIKIFPNSGNIGTIKK
ncbi:MAG: DNA polymerase III subunit alpha, partial [Desulfosalsimonadaceae bacterium]